MSPRSVLVSGLALVASTVSAQPVPTGTAAAPGWGPIFTEVGIDDAMHGVWRSRGYGWVLDVRADAVVGYDDGAAGCLRDDDVIDGLGAWAGIFARSGDAMRLSFRPENSTQYTFDRLPALPDACLTPPEPTPTAVFDYVWTVMDEHYAFFDLHGVDWRARRAEVEPVVRDDMSEAELFDALVALVDGLDDAHLTIVGEVDGEARRHVGERSAAFGAALRAAHQELAPEAPLGAFAEAWFEAEHERVRDELLGGAMETAANGRVRWGRRGDVGYLAITGMGGIAETEDAAFADEVAAVHAVMGRALTDLADTDALVVDVTLNGGGYEEIALAFAAHFADAPTPALSKYVPGAEADTRRTFTVVPAEVRYLKPVTLLTSDVTVSAAEAFTMEMRALPTVTHAGETTRGALSDVLVRPLPNGWTLGLSNEVYLDADGELWEDRGIPPTAPVPVFPPDDLAHHVEAIRTVMDRSAR